MFRLSGKIVQRTTERLKSAEVHCRPTYIGIILSAAEKMAQGTYFMAVGSCRYSRGFAREGVLNESEVFENGDFCFFRSL